MQMYKGQKGPKIYKGQKGPNEERFEIIYLSVDDKSDNPAAFRAIRMPFWVCSLDQRDACSLAFKLFKLVPLFPAAVAFGSDGHLETREDDLANKLGCLKSKYPFIHDMDEQVRKEINIVHAIDIEYYLENDTY